MTGDTGDDPADPPEDADSDADEGADRPDESTGDAADEGADRATESDSPDEGGDRADPTDDGRSTAPNGGRSPGDEGPGGDGPGGESTGGGGRDPDPGPGPGAGPGSDDPGVDPNVRALREDLADLQDEVDDLEDRVDEKTVHRDDITAELKRYVRARQRRGHATGWGPYIVLLYGTAMSLGAFYYLGGLAAIAALIVVWLSTLGLFVVMLIAGLFIGAGRKLGGLRDLVGKLRR